MRLTPAGDDIGYVESLLADCELPTADIRSKRERFFIGYRDGDRIGVGGIEHRGRAGLLRSLAVEPSARDQGHGSELCDGLEREAKARGIETLYLLTTTAAPFFADRGYREVERTDVPRRIRETTEFDELCPASATCMKKSL